MAIYAVGDLQGCATEFEQLLQKIQFNRALDRLWLTGDLVNRGPRSLDCLRLVRALGDAAVTVLGNHDLHLLALVYAPAEKRKSQDTLDDVLNAPDRDVLLEWLAQRPMLHHDAAMDTVMIHAGLAPEWDIHTAKALAGELEHALRDPKSRKTLFANMYGDQPDRWSPRLTGVDRLRFITNCLTRLRLIAADGSIDLKSKGRPEDAPGGHVPWFRAPHRRSRRHRILFGHWSALGFYEGDNVVCLDTGCVWGNSLCALRLDQPSRPVYVACVGESSAQE
jgi:bis(5'-nucleosyl)-tetraphosphatase (symmetrical)